MSDYVLSCSSTVDLTPEQMKKRGIHYVCFHFFLDNKDYADDMGHVISPKELYTRMLEGAETKTSQVLYGDYILHFEKHLQEGKDILHIEFSSGLSGSYNTACMAAKELSEKYPERKLYVIDSLGASSGYGLILETMADMRDSGKTIDELRDWLEHNKLRMHHWFFSTDLKFYIKGGRISKTAGMVGTVLNICPLLNMDNLGKLRPREKIRGKRKVSQRIVEMMEQHAENGLNYSGKCYISHSDCLEDAETVAALIEQEFTQLCEPVKIYPVGATIGSHTGPGTVALFFWGDERVE